MIALAIEECNLHRRVALNALRFVGTSPRMLLLGFMVPTAFLSMWISNTASSAMMIPILEAVLTEVLSDPSDAETGKSGSSSKSQISAKNMRAMLAMSVCMSANIGGTATTIGNFRRNQTNSLKEISLIYLFVYSRNRSHLSCICTFLYLSSFPLFLLPLYVGGLIRKSLLLAC